MAGAAGPLSRGSFRQAGKARERLRSRLARAAGANCERAWLRPNGVGGPGLERTCDPVLSEARRQADGRVDGVSADAGGNRGPGVRKFLLMILILLMISQRSRG